MSANGMNCARISFQMIHSKVRDIQVVCGLSQLLLQGARGAPGVVAGSLSDLLFHLCEVHDLGRARNVRRDGVGQGQDGSIIKPSGAPATSGNTGQDWKCTYTFSRTFLISHMEYPETFSMKLSMVFVSG